LNKFKERISMERVKFDQRKMKLVEQRRKDEEKAKI